ncbi:type VI secretion system accessory protein TagJ [Burkholderia pyrrocinia]|uniref:type VI secretion system accessory protein TagJ n=1 Tax=Burkholderia pyrrocinia TaxID=60550 RepID=UPI001FC87614|nr:type VI secretion system accessory protein TagJ [Burkholderia pyrrocinia]
MTSNILSVSSGPDATATQYAPFQAGTLAEQLHEAQERVRALPGDADLRWGLSQLLCVMGEWPRAVEQLRVFAQLRTEATHLAQTYRELIRAECWREKVLAGQADPGSLADLPHWAAMLVEAMRLSVEGRTDEADEKRLIALDQAPLVAGRGAQIAFDWIADSDSHLGPICEVVMAGHYRWLPISEIRAWRIRQPESLFDLVWAPCTLMCVDGQSVAGFMPARYPVRDETGDSDADAIRLGHKTLWRERGPTAIVASGRKTWATSAGDFDVFELNACEFGASVADAVTED